MLNLLEQLSTIDNKRIINYISKYGVESEYVGNEKYLRLWADNKKKLFHLLGGNLIIKKPFSYEKTSDLIQLEINKLLDKNNFLIKLESKINFINIPSDIKSKLFYSYKKEAFLLDKTLDSIKYKEEGRNGTLQLQVGMKPIRAVQKIIKYFELYELEVEFEQFRIALSRIYNEKHISGNLCLSIHPLDFMTMSDNDSDWSSCMSWINGGCYRIGTVEMMNSNNVICAYIESKNSFNYGGGPDEEDWSWNNKKWRQLFYVTKDIIVGGKSYPYANDDFTKEILNILRGLAANNLNWTYSFGPEPYRDMVHIGSWYRMDNNRQWIKEKRTFKHNILFDTKGMYNDMLNDSNRSYLCIRNKVKNTKIISYSGKTSCLCCNNEVIWDNDPYIHNEDSYNDRYGNINNLLCEDCLEERHCTSCGNITGYFNVYEIDGRKLCKKCWEEKLKECPDCKKPFIFESSFVRRGPYIRIKDKALDKSELYCACPNCRKEVMMSNSFEEINEEGGIYPHIDNYIVSKKFFDQEDEYVQRHKKNNLEKIPFSTIN